MADGRLTVEWDQVAWLAMKIVRSNSAKPRRIKFENPYEIVKRQRTVRPKTSGDYKGELLGMAQAFASKQQAG